MFNSPILDVAIGLVFIFLLYSLLATSIKEAIATLLGLRASMLKKGIVDGMLSDTPAQFKLIGILQYFWKLVVTFFSRLGLVPAKPEAQKLIGDKFYDHPIIKNYGSSRIFPLPSYIPSSNFSLVLIEVLKNDFANKIEAIAANKKLVSSVLTDIETLKKELLLANDATSIKELLDYYSSLYQQGSQIPQGIINKETCQILVMHLQKSMYDMNAFAKRLENWFDDSMDRVSGWYKRQVQVILFMLGIAMAIIFNVDTLQIAGKLTNDKDARDKMVQLAIKTSEQYKEDPRVKPITDKDNRKEDSVKRANNINVFEQYQSKMSEAKKVLDTNISNANSLLALGWGDFGLKRDSAFVLSEKYKTEADTLINHFLKDIKFKKSLQKNDTLDARKFALTTLYSKDHWINLKVGYVFSEAFKGRKMLGFLILAFAVCLGAPFWFDLLNKLVKLRGSGKKEDSNSGGDAKTAAGKEPITINVNTQKSGEEAVG